MANTFQEQMLADATSGGVFFPGTGKGFDATLTHYPGGDLSAGESLVVIFDRDLEDVGGVGEGEGPQFDQRQSDKLRRNAVLALPITATITESSGTNSKPSLFDYDGHRWKAVRILARDSAMQDVLVTRLQKLAARGVGRR